MWPKVKAKFGNKKTKCSSGYSHPSKLECDVCELLLLRMKAGEFISIQHQDHVYLTPARILYIPDFKCTLTNGEPLWIEAKGKEMDVWNLKKRLWPFFGPGVLEIWKGNKRGPYLFKTIFPKGVPNEPNT